MLHASLRAGALLAVSVGLALSASPAAADPQDPYLVQPD